MMYTQQARKTLKTSCGNAHKLLKWNMGVTLAPTLTHAAMQTQPHKRVLYIRKYKFEFGRSQVQILTQRPASVTEAFVVS